MRKLDNILAANKEWAENIKQADPDFFPNLSELQTPEYLWIGCSDSRITPAVSFGMLPGEMFVHRNVANMIIHSDMNCLSVIQFAVEALKIKHLIVCGHYGCGGVNAALNNTRYGLIDNWLRHIQDLMHKYQNELSRESDREERLDRLCTINVIEQVVSAGGTTIVQDAWERGQELTVHGLIYTIADGIYRDLNVSVDNMESLERLRTRTIEERHEIGIAGRS